MSIRLLLADDQPLMRAGFQMILEETDDIEVVGEAQDGTEAVRLAGELNPDVILMDVRMPGVDGIEATREIVARNRAARVLILTTFDLDEYAFSALRAGASGFVLKDVPVDELARAIRAVASGDAVVSPWVTRRLLDGYATHLPGLSGNASGPAHALNQLTRREQEVLLEMANGLSNTEIAEKLVVSEATVKTHVGSILAKLDLRNRVQAGHLRLRRRPGPVGVVQPGMCDYLRGLLRPRARNKTLTGLAGAEPIAGAQHREVQRLQWFLSESA